MILNKIKHKEWEMIHEKWYSKDMNIWVYGIYAKDKYGIKHTPIKDPLSAKIKELKKCLIDYIAYVDTSGGLDKMVKNFPKYKENIRME